MSRYHASWPSPAIERFEKHIAAHGGWDAWDRFDRVTLDLVEFRGLLPFVKGLGRTFVKPNTITIDPKKRVTEFGYGSYSDVFIDGKLIYSLEKIEIADGRSIFKKTTFERWTPAHALYFFGYAWANYIGYPFILTPFELLEWKTGAGGSVFKIRFPESFHTHCPVQTFYFAEYGKLARHDYHAPFAGPFVYGAHKSEGYEATDGVQIGLIRKVHERIGTVALPGYGIYARLSISK